MRPDLVSHGFYGFFVFLFLLGFYAMIFNRHFLRKIIGMYILQTAVILFWLLLSVKWGGTVPIIAPGVAAPEFYMNPLPHTLMLTAIVVGISTTGVSLALLMLIHKRYETLEEDKVLERMQ